MEPSSGLVLGFALFCFSVTSVERLPGQSPRTARPGKKPAGQVYRSKGSSYTQSTFVFLKSQEQEALLVLLCPS